MTRYGDRFDQIWQESGDRLSRFVCFDTRSMRWGWARVGKGRISRIHQGLTRFETLTYQEKSIGVFLEALPVKSSAEPNLAVVLKYRNEPVCRLTGTLLLDSVVIDAVQPTDCFRSRLFDFSRLQQEVMQNQGGLRDSLLNSVAEPFEYADGSKLTGVSPKSFFGPGYYTAYLGQIGQNPTVVVADR